uniref:Apelin receptor early endogenous ligand n=1 Tax=Sinocyclocheilus anshuiensis TaxID=1608454 RepID=A0A671MGN9_9TELE
ERIEKNFATLILLIIVYSPNKSFFLPFPDFLNLRRKYRRHNCPKKRCLPLHSRVPFP